jgi:hypothetical protein
MAAAAGRQAMMKVGTGIGEGASFSVTDVGRVSTCGK